MQEYNRNSIKDELLGPGFKLYRRRTPTLALQVTGPFVVRTATGRVKCTGGYVVINDEGFAYPMEAKAFHEMFERVVTPG